MPVPVSELREHDHHVFPDITTAHIDAARTSAWYTTFEDLTTPARIVNLTSIGEEDAFRTWLDGDSIFLPEGSAALNDTSTSLEAEARADEDAPVYHLPKLNQAIRSAIHDFGGAVFPKLNWTSPRDAAFIIPQTEGGPLYCKTPADVYLVLKASDFISHDLDHQRAYLSGYGPLSDDNEEHEDLTLGARPVQVEIVLKKYVQINPSHEWRCFVRDNVLIGITQRDGNFYDFLQSIETRQQVIETVRDLWEDEIRLNFEGGPSYVFDVYLSSNLLRATVVDFNPYRQSTDPLLFTYEELFSIFTSYQRQSASSTPLPVGLMNEAATHSGHARLPILKIIESLSDPEASRPTPTYAANMMPLDVMALSQGRNMVDFKDAWDEAVAQGIEDSSDEND